MTSPEVTLRAVWHRLPGTGGHDDLLEGLLARLREPHRRYHTATHVMWVLRHAQDLFAAVDGPIDTAAVELAALFHDAVYDPLTSDNEAVSAELARSVAVQLGWSAARAELVRSLVAATALGHDTAPDPTTAVLLDADLAILGADPGEYLAYVNGVRHEFAHVADPDWRVGRADVVRHLLARDPLYRTAAMRQRREARARANLTAELAALDSAGTIRPA